MKKYFLYTVNSLLFTTLLTYGAEHDKHLLKACRIGTTEKNINSIIASGANVNCHDSKGNSPLHYACIYENEDAVKSLLKSKTIFINQQNNLNNTALIIACSKNNIPIVKLLLAHPHINLSLANNQGNTAAHIAAYFDYEEIIKMLIKHNQYSSNLYNNRLKTVIDVAHEGGSRNIELLKTNSQ